MPHCRHFLFDFVKSYHVDEGSVHGEKPSQPEISHVLLAIAAILVATGVEPFNLVLESISFL